MTVKIDIAAQFTGKNAFKQAETSTQKLERSVKNLGRSLGLAFSATAIVAFGKASVKAFAEDEKAARSLAQALANTGNAFATMGVEQFIADLQRATGVLDDQLRPAFRTLLTATGDVTKSQNALQLALDISAGTGKDLASVTAALAKGFSGNTTALSRLGAGLSKATLKSNDMVAITDELSKKFSGQAAVAAEGYSGQLARLTVASANAKEIIGKELLDAMARVSGDQGIGGATTAMEGLATQIGNVIAGTSVLLAQFNKLGGLGSGIAKALNPFGFTGLGALSRLGASTKTGTPGQSPGQRMAIDKQNAALQKEKNNLLKIDNQLTKDKLKLSADQKVLEALKKIFDPEQAQLAAAAANATDSETKARITALQAIKDNDTNQAKLAVSALFASGALDGFGNALLEAIQKLAGINLKAYALYGTEQFTPAQQQLETLGIPQGYGNMIVPQSIASASDFYTNPAYAQYREQAPIQVEVKLNDQVFANAVTSVTQGSSSNGTSLSYNPILNR